MVAKNKYEPWKDRKIARREEEKGRALNKEVKRIFLPRPLGREIKFSDVVCRKLRKVPDLNKPHR